MRMTLRKDSFSLWRSIVLVVITLSNADIYAHLRESRSIKDALPKDDEFSQSRAILDMRHKIFNLESSIKSMNTEIEKISSQNSNLQSSVIQQKAMIENLNVEFHSLKEILSGHANTIGDLEQLASTDENLFAISNQTCGGMIVGQTGSIVFSSAALRGIRYPSTCIWTIRANNRGTVKITNTHTYRSYAYTRPNAYVVEIVTKNETNITNVQPSDLTTKITRLERNIPQLFKGPVVFVVYVLTSYQSDDYSEIDLHLHFEGLGTLVQKTTHFSHESLYENSGNFSNTQIQDWRNPWIGQANATTYTLEYTSIVISNFSTKAHLQVILENGQCGDKDTSLVVVTNLLESNVDFVDCCKQSCDGKNSLINYDNPFVILIFKKYGIPLKFRLNWEAETPYPSTTRIGTEPGNLYGHKCGEVLGGTSGTILYKPHVSYRNGERCIWAIVPQPRPRSSIVINVGANGVESTYDHLYVLELTDVNGTALEDAPKITRLGRYGSYEAHSREVYVVFYSDSSVTGYGFSITWRSTGQVVKTGNDVTTRFMILKDENGVATSLQERPSLTTSVYQVFLLTPIVPYSYIFGMQLHINQTHPTPANCLHEDIQVFTAVDGVLTKPDMEELCSAQTEPGKIAIENADGMAMIVLNDRNPGAHLAMSFSWQEEFGDGNTTYVSVENNECGGVIIGDKGVLKYKIGIDYANNERCVWLLQTPNHTSITLKLLKDGFETCCDSILVTTVDPINGTLRNDTTVINRLNRTRTFDESVLVIVFRSDTSTRGRGFALQFTGNGEAETSTEFRYQLRHHDEPFGTISYPSSEWNDPIPGKTDILVIASSIKVGLDEDPLTMPTNISWISGVFKKANDDNCSYESVTFYTTPDAHGWLMRERFPNVNDTSSCQEEITVSKKADIINTVYSAFVVVYKHVYVEDEEDQEVMKMGFTFEKSAGCGGVIIGDSGEISYKEDGKYSNGEKCIWLIHAPQAEKIRFYLERSGFEACCDLIYVHTISDTGTPLQSALIQQGNRSALVNGPVAIVVFTSDGSVTGDGFRLIYSTHTNVSEPFPFTYHLEHRNQPSDNRYIFQVEKNEVVVTAFSPELYRVGTQGRTQITIASMRPQIDESCNSDQLSIYEVFGSDRGLVFSKSFNALDVLKTDSYRTVHDEMLNGTCSALENKNLNNCNNILECGDVPENNVFNMNGTSFVAIYKSANVSGDLDYRGLVMMSTTSYSTLSSSSA